MEANHHQDFRRRFHIRISGDEVQKTLAFNEAAVEASRKHAELLRVKPGFPLLLMRETQFEIPDRRCLYSVIYHNSALLEFTLKRPGWRS
jgi:GntR family transcriptional regulator